MMRIAGDGICTRTGPLTGFPLGSKPSASAIPPPRHIFQTKKPGGNDSPPRLIISSDATGFAPLWNSPFYFLASLSEIALRMQQL